ncbi:hypothetical protein FZEAL_3334 [Fusarium zealandicum]|uniref:Uncharacterized protein n=1 Tax=Fusarium zealandicum TaxID=1053134 RepID=A0A8H4UPT3_9HYPO|nr:hypothetical protein FZEAL_3334 [Fusarium zealandicum]
MAPRRKKPTRKSKSPKPEPMDHGIDLTALPGYRISPLSQTSPSLHSAFVPRSASNDRLPIDNVPPTNGKHQSFSGQGGVHMAQLPAPEAPECDQYPEMQCDGIGGFDQSMSLYRLLQQVDEAYGIRPPAPHPLWPVVSSRHNVPGITIDFTVTEDLFMSTTYEDVVEFTWKQILVSLHATGCSMMMNELIQALRDSRYPDPTKPMPVLQDFMVPITRDLVIRHNEQVALWLAASTYSTIMASEVLFCPIEPWWIYFADVGKAMEKSRRMTLSGESLFKQTA